MEKLCYSVKEACEALGISTPTLYKLMNSGELKSKKLGAKRVIPVEALKELLQEAK